MSRRMLINLSTNIIAFCVNFGISFFLTPFIVEQVGSDAYGFVGLTNNFISYAQLFTVALNSMAGRFITIEIHRKDIKSANKYFNSIFFSNIIMSIGITIVATLFLINIEQIIDIPIELLLDIKYLFCFMFINLLISVISSIFSVATFATNSLHLASLRNIESNIIKGLLLLVLFSLLKPSISFMGSATLIATIYLCIRNIIYIKKFLPQFKISTKYIEKEKIIRVLKSGLWNSFARLSQILGTGLDLLFANIYIGSEEMGVLAIAKTVPTFIQSFIGNIVSIFTPINTKLYAEGKINELAENINKSIKLMGIITSIPIAGLLALGDSFYLLWVPTENYKVLHILSVITMIGFVVGASLEPLYNVFIVTNKVKLNSIVLFISSICSTITVLYLLNKTSLGIFAIAGVSCFFESIRNITFLPLYSAKLLNVKRMYFYKPMFKNFFSIFIVYFVGVYLKKIIYIDSWVKFVIVVIITTIVGLIINILIVYSKQEIIEYKESLKKIVKK